MKPTLSQPTFATTAAVATQVGALLAPSLVLFILLFLVTTPAFAQTTRSSDYTALGKDIVVPAGTTVNGDVTVWGGNVRVLGTVTGRVTAVGGQVIVGDSARVEQNVTAIGGDVALGDTANVGRDALALGGLVNTTNTASVGGSTASMGNELVQRVNEYFGLSYSEPADRLRNVDRDFLNTFSWTAIVFIFGVALLFFAPRALDNTSITLNYAPGMAVLIGLFTTIIIPLVLAALAVLLIISVVGIAALPVLVALAAIAVAYSLVVSGLWLGERLTALLGKPNYSDTRRQLIPLALGLVIIALVSLLLNLAMPPLGGLFNALLLSFGLGAAVLSRFGQARPSAAPLPIVD